MALRNASDAHTHCVPSWQHLLSADPHFTLLGVGHPCQKQSVTCSVLTQYRTYTTQTELLTQHSRSTMPCTAVAEQSHMHSIRWTELHARQLDALHAQHCLHSTTSCTALLAQYHVMRSATCTALHAQHSCTAQHTQQCMHSTTHTANPGQGSSSGRGGKLKKGVAWICREEIAARKAHKVCIWCATAGHISRDCPNEKPAEPSQRSSHLGSPC